MDVLFVFIAGLCLGSFLSVIIYREANEEKFSRKNKKSGFLPAWAYGRSRCDHCGRLIRWYDNIPLLSYALLAGKCRYCSQKIPIQYPLLELMTGIEFVWIYLIVKYNLIFFGRFEGFYSLFLLIFYLMFGALLLMIFVSDIKYQIIPDTGIVFIFLLLMVKQYLDYLYTGYIDWSFVPGALLPALLFAGLILLTRGKGMGWGDVKLAAALGYWLGLANAIIGLYLSFLTGGLAASILLVLGKKKLGQTLAFGPFLILGSLLAYFFGTRLWEWYFMHL